MPKTALEVILAAYQNPANDALRLAHNDAQNCIGSWDEGKQRFVMVAALTIVGGGYWVEMPYELLVNGKHIVENWTEVPRAVPIGKGV
jgi:hypothetical protein